MTQAGNSKHGMVFLVVT